MKDRPIKLPDFPLSNCPFCGGKAKKGKTENMANVYCVVCGAQTRVFNNINDAISAWEMRIDKVKQQVWHDCIKMEEGAKNENRKSVL